MSTDLPAAAPVEAAELAELVDRLPLLDHHVHGATLDELDADTLASMLTESDRPAAAGTSGFDSQVGFAVRRWCAPVLDLPAHAPIEDYLARRRELGGTEVTRRLLAASGIGGFLLDTGYASAQVLDVDGMRAVSGRPAAEVVRLEAVAEDVARRGCGAAEFPARFAEELAKRTAGAVGLKSVVAYRFGLDFEAERPDDREVAAAAGRWLAGAEHPGGLRLADPVLLRHVIWAGVDTGLPLQFHVGYGDPDLELHRCNPLLMTRWLRLVEHTGVSVLLLHCYPYHREAGYLAQAFPHVYFDVGLAVNYTGARSKAVVAESLELAPFGKLLFSSDAWGPAELHHLGAALWRRAVVDVVCRWVADGDWSAADARRVVRLVGVDNARRVYRLGEEWENA